MRFGRGQLAQVADHRHARGHQREQQRRAAGESQRGAQADVLAQPAAEQRARAGGDEDQDTFLERHAGDAEADPMHMLRDQRLREALVAAIKNLPEREQYIMSMYYEQDMNLKEIAAVLDVTESRVCQLHSQSIARLRSKMRAH